MSLGHLLGVIGEIDFVPDFCRFVLDSLYFDLRPVHSYPHHQQLGHDYYHNYRHQRYRLISSSQFINTAIITIARLTVWLYKAVINTIANCHHHRPYVIFLVLIIIGLIILVLLIHMKSSSLMNSLRNPYGGWQWHRPPSEIQLSAFAVPRKVGKLKGYHV